MGLITEADVRALCLPAGGVFPLPAGAVLTPLAQEYLRERGIMLIDGNEKPEHMTHLRAGELVPKRHPRIRLRGKLDSLEALLLLTAREARDAGRTETAAALDEMHALVCRILGSEVKGEALGPFTLLGFDSAGLRDASHHPPGGQHPVPHSGMGRLCLALNYVRTQVREAELAAAEAFIAPSGAVEREDLIEALNRLSSAAYLLFLGEV